MLPVIYSKRERAGLAGETVYRAEAEAFVAERPDGTRIVIPWAHVQRARLAAAPARGRPARLVFTLAAPEGIVVIDNFHFAGGGRYQARAADFAAFVRAAAERLSARAPEAGLRLGLSRLSYAGQALLSVGGVALAGVVLLALGWRYAGPLVGAALVVLLAALALPRLARFLWRARPRQADAAALAAAAGPD